MFFVILIVVLILILILFYFRGGRICLALFLLAALVPEWSDGSFSPNRSQQIWEPYEQKLTRDLNHSQSFPSRTLSWDFSLYFLYFLMFWLQQSHDKKCVFYSSISHFFQLSKKWTFLVITVQSEHENIQKDNIQKEISGQIESNFSKKKIIFILFF
jgi:hypothetical protein